MATHSPRAPILARRREAPRRTLVTVAISVATAGALGLIVYLTGTLMPSLLSSAASDAEFGAMNQCATAELREPIVGFAVAADGARIAAYSGSALAVCEKGKGGAASLAGRYELRGVSAAAFDFGGTLWAAVSREKDREPELWHVAGAAPVRVGDVAPIALAGHALGVVALDGAGKLVSLGKSGDALGFADLPKAPAGEVHLAVNADGSRVSVAAGTGVFVFDAKTLEPVYAEGPCEVEFLWWTRDANRAIAACGPGASWALELDVRSGARDAAEKRDRVRSALVPKLGRYVQPCNQLPCTAPEP